MKNIAVIFGGRSVEHDVSILTGLHAAEHVNENVRVHYVYLDRENVMYTGERLSSIDYYLHGLKSAKRCWFSDGCLCRGFRKTKIDVALNCCHGGVGERGELAAYLKVAGVPITSCDYISAANMQSKIRTREILSLTGFEQPKYIAVNKTDFIVEVAGVSKSQVAHGLIGDLSFPVIVKPDTLGSSIGINIARTEVELADALELVFQMDERAIVEQFFEKIVEVNCAVMRSGNDVMVSACEQINTKHEFLDYESKYLDSSSGFIKKGKTAGQEKEFNNIKELAKKAYEIMGARGVIRADFMIVDSDNDKSLQKIYLNEINTVPGFLAYHLWVRAGYPYGLVLNLLAKQATIDAEHDKSLITVFKSDILIKNRGLIN